MKLNDDYDDDEDFLDDDADDYEERPKKSFFKKSQSDSFDDIEDDFEEEPLARKSLKQPVKTLKTVNYTAARYHRYVPARQLTICLYVW